MTPFAGSSGPAISVFMRAMAFLAGIDPKRIVQPSDTSMVVKAGLVMMFIGGWQAFVFNYIGQLATDTPDTFNPAIAGFAVLAAIFIVILDSAVFMAPSWTEQGRAELKRAGLHIPKGLREYLEDVVFLGLRLLLAAALVQLGAFTFACVVYAKDMSAILVADWHAANSELIEAAEGEYQRRDDDAKEALSSARQVLSASRTQETALRETAVDPSAGDADLARLRDTLTALEDAKQEAERDLADAEVFAANELGGVRGPGNSGIAGAGPVRRAAEERVAIAKRRANELGQAILAAKAERDDARRASADMASRKGAAAKAALDQIAAQRNALEDNVARRESDYAALRAGRETFLRTRVESDPAHVPLETGLLAKIGTLPKLAADPAKVVLMAVLEILLFLSEFGAIFVKARSKPPSACARHLAFDDILDAAVMAHTLADRLDQLAPRGDTMATADVPRDAPADNAAFGDVLEPSGLDDEEVETEERVTRAVRRTGTLGEHDADAGDGVGLGDGRVEAMVFGEQTTIERKRGRPKGSRSRPRLPFDSTPGMFGPGKL